ncbi:MAG TPA: TlpA disulfide reductase family protein [Acidobacteriota bacterium]|nr:TlpA disulfide reductase family protein [Acidobacteriota bacterium]
MYKIFTTAVGLLSIFAVTQGALAQDAPVAPSGAEAEAELSIDLPELPAFELPDLTGEMRSLEELKGRVTMVNFFFPSCVGCNQELPFLKRLYEKYRDFGFSLISINIHPAQNRQLTRWAQKGGYSHPILRTESDAWRKAFRVEGTPTNCLLGDDNTMLKRYEGYSPHNLERMEEAVRRMLGLDK